MSKFKNVKHVFLHRKVIEYWRNMAVNNDGRIGDDDFFAPVEMCVEPAEVVSLILAAFEDSEINEMEHGPTRRNRLEFDDSAQMMLYALWNNEKYRAKTKCVFRAIYKLALRKLGKTSRNEPLEHNFSELQRALKLSDLEREIATLAYAVFETPLMLPTRCTNSGKAIFYAMALDVSHSEVVAALSPNGRLMRFGVLDDDWDFCARKFASFISGAQKEPIEGMFYKKICGETLPWDFYGELSSRHGAVIKRMLSAGKGKLNILFYGAPGTGKTSFAKTIAAEMNLTPYEISQGREDGREMNSESRLAGIQICNEQTAGMGGMMIIDEADELLRGGSDFFSMFFGGGSRKSTEKGIVNTILDEMKGPAIWITNTAAEQIDESVRRRFDYAVRFDRLNAVQREAIWRNCVKKFKLGKLIDDARIPSLAMAYATSAGGISAVLGNLKKMNPSKATVEKEIAVLMKSHCELVGVRDHQSFLPVDEYSLDGLNVTSSIPLEKIEKSVRKYTEVKAGVTSGDKARMTLLLHGVPGSGKTEWVKHLGATLGKKVVVKMGSDILGMYVGQTEKNIRDAFRQAEAEDAILFFDEADAFLQKRQNAVRSFEVSQVDELLHDLEETSAVTVFATNFIESLDDAVLRRCSFKIEFGPLDNAGKELFFGKVFGAALNEAGKARLASISGLTPGDFRAVKESLRYLDEDIGNDIRLKGLEEEAKTKSASARKVTVGF